MAEDIAVSLLAQYYGISEESETKKFPSIQECVSSIENDSDKLVGEQSTVDTNGDDTSKETEVQENDIENKEENSEIDTLARSSRALKWEAIEDNEATSSEFDIIFKTNAMDNLYENTCTSSGKETHDLAACSKTASTTLGLEDNEGNDSYLSLSEDVLPDSASDVSSITGKKKTAIMFVPPSTPPPNRTPIYNETFVDLTSTDLTSLPIEIIEKYPAIQMLYLENNNLPELPERLFVSLQNLQWLDVRNNLLTSLPTTIKSHPSLETILLQGNKIEKLPLELCLVPKLKILNVAHNPITTPPKDIIVLGCSSILSYLRSEWNKLHPNEPVTFAKREIEPKASTILCYRSPREKRWKLSKIPRRISKSTNDISDSLKGSAVRKKSKAYKPSNRCEGTGINIVMEQRQQWISKARDLLSAQSAIIQKIKDLDTVKEWRRDKQSFIKSMEKISKRNEDDIPFAIDIEDYPAIQKRSQKAGDYTDNQKQEKLKLVNINQKIQELSGFLQKFEITKSSEILTPKSKQKYLQTEIEKLSHFQKEVHNLRRCNEIMSAPMNSPNNLS
ncbi:PREDICTED: leucine-rich repeat-containing protein 27-like [Trachymyrmex cornetzi]|uniref:Leucine-rich repeat-containing protein 27 n=1 Tax=Trachymyrmex cornetzi TaxID=471704 RepID=A0A151JP34_9HYME|nr:PREDICTED: leucine-rich repeat-containing protein 27-like [Trachymyrmex cornetzi]KYN28543.1 Leucine-rich repeat-containing protein 27 [Trachymyrmex cornetzi]